MDVKMLLFLTENLDTTCTFILQQDRQCNIEVLPFDDYFIGKSIIITYSECVFLALFIRHEMRMRHIVICGVSGSTPFYHIAF